MGISQTPTTYHFLLLSSQMRRISLQIRRGSPAGASAVSTHASIQAFAERNARDIAFVAVQHGLGCAWERTPKDLASHVEDGLMRAKKAPNSNRSIRTARYQKRATRRGGFRATAGHASYTLLMQTPPLSANGRSRCFEQIHPASHFLHAVAWSQSHTEGRRNKSG